MINDNLKKVIAKATELEQGKEIAIAKEFISIEEKLEEMNDNFDTLTDELKKKLDEELSYEVDEAKIVESVLSKVVIPEPIPGADGKDYILTEKDKLAIAQSIEVPIVEKIIERTEVIKEQPIVTNNVTEVNNKEFEHLAALLNDRLTAIEKGFASQTTQKNIGFGSMMKEAPRDSNYYVRRNRSWVQLPSGVSGSGTANQLTYWVNSTTLGSLTTATYPSLTEISYVKGVTSSIQTQLNSKLSSAIISLNGLTGSSQTFAGSGISISSTGTTHTFTNTGVTSLNSPTTNITLSASTGAVDIDVNQGYGYTWTGDHIFTSNIDFTPTDSTSIFFDMNIDTNASVPSRLRFLNNGGIMSSLEINVDQGKDIRYLLPKDQPSTGQILYVSDFTADVATLGFTSASGDVIGPGTAVTSGEMTVFDTDTTHIKGVTSITAGNFATIGSNSVFYPNENVLSVGTVSSTYSGSFASSTNGANGLWIYNGNTGTSKITQLILQAASTTGGDVWGTLRAYPSNYTTGALASRFEIKAGTSQQMVFEVDSNFEWRKSTTPVAKLTTAGFLSGNGSPLAQLHALQGTLGSDVLRLESVASGDDVRQSTYQNRVATTTNTQTTLHTFTLAATTTYLIEARVTARRTGGSAGTAEDSAGYVIRGTYKNVAGTATLVGTLDTPYTAEDQAAWDATFTVTGATVLCRVTGATNNNITWHMTATVNQLTS